MRTRSTEFILLSASLACAVPCSMYLVTSSAYTSVRPARPGGTPPAMTRNAASVPTAVPRKRSRTLSHSAARRCVTQARPLAWICVSDSAMKCAPARYARMVATPATASARSL